MYNNEDWWGLKIRSSIGKSYVCLGYPREVRCRHPHLTGTAEVVNAGADCVNIVAIALLNCSSIRNKPLIDRSCLC